MADFSTRLDEIKTRSEEISTEIDNYKDSGINLDDSDVRNRLIAIKSIAAQRKSEVQDMIEFFHSRADQFEEDYGNVNIDSTVESGDPRRPGLDG